MMFCDTVTDEVLEPIKNEPVLKDYVNKLYVIKNLEGYDNLVLVLKFNKNVSFSKENDIIRFIGVKYNIEVDSFYSAYNYMFKDLVKCNIIKLPDATKNTFFKNFLVREVSL